MPDPTQGGYSTNGQPVPLSDDGLGSRSYWKKQIEASWQRTKDHQALWNRVLQSYRGKPLTVMPAYDTVVVPRDFPFVEQKISQLFFQTPEIHLTARQDSLQDAVSVFQPVMNYYLSEDGVDALSLMNEVLFDALCPSGLMVSKIGYENFKGPAVPVNTSIMGAEPGAESVPPEAQTPSGLSAGPSPSGLGPEGLLPGQVLGLGAPAPPPPVPPAVPQTTPLQPIVYERFFWERVSPAAYLCPLGFGGSNYDKAPWQGFKFEEDWTRVKACYGLDPHLPIPRSRNLDKDDLRLKTERQDQSTSSRVQQDKVTGTEIWYRRCTVDPQEPHPEVIWQLILVDGMEDPLVHRASPYQKRTMDGQLIGMKGFPVHVGALRYMSDAAFPPSECHIAEATNQELNKSRTQMMLQRDRSIPMRIADPARVGGEPGLEKIRTNIYQGVIPISGYDPNKPPIGVVGLASYPRENFAFNDYLDGDLGQVWAMGQNQRGQEADTSLTATEVSKIDEWATTRLDKERRKALGYFIGGCRKLGALIQMFAPDGQVVEIIGPDKMPRLQQWDRTSIQGEFAYSAKPDSSIRIDQSQQQQRVLKLYELLRKDPNVQGTELLTEICHAWNLDPTKVILQQVPEKGPDPASLSMRLDPESVNITNPNFPLYYALLKEAGYKSLDQPDPAMGNKTPIQMAMEWNTFQQQIINMGMGGQAPTQGPPTMGTGQPAGLFPRQPEHPGTAPRADHLSKHHADQSGERPGPKVN